MIGTEQENLVAQAAETVASPENKLEFVTRSTKRHTNQSSRRALHHTSAP
jgi:hypothetical protein